MKSNSILRVLVALAASSSALGLYALEPGRPDPRTRTFLPPARVVWTSGDAVYGNRSVVKNAESLLQAFHLDLGFLIFVLLHSGTHPFLPICHDI